MFKVALVTYQELPELTKSDGLLIKPLLRRDIHAVPVAWDDTTVNWKSFDCVVMRSVWDYHLRIAEFRTWLNHLEAQQVNVWNPIPVIRWNMDKFYLKELHVNGIQSFPAIYLEQGQNINLTDLLTERDWQKVIIKPRISASAYQTWVLNHEDASTHQEKFATLLTKTPVMVQKFAEEIAEGEWSFIFFNGIYSHAVLKRPAPQNIYVQTELGGTLHTETPPSHFIGQASQILQVTQQILSTEMMYARVDAVVVDHALRLMELELIEPELFLDRVPPEAVERFADAIARKLKINAYAYSS